MKFTFLTFLSTITYSLAIITMLYVAYLIFWPFRPISITNPIPILNKGKIIYYNQPVLTKITYCVYDAVPDTSERIFREIGGNNISYFLNPHTGTPKVGCGISTNTNYKVPTEIPPGKYRIDITITYHVNPLRNVSETISTEDFTIKKN